MTDTAAVAEPTPASPLIRIQAISLTNFRAFPGPSAARFELHGKNLLVYGENGAGKSSLFHALAGFFSSKPAGPLADHKNVFNSKPDAECRVSVEYVGDAKPVDWTTTEHPCIADEDFPETTDMYEWYFGNSDFRTIDAARRCGFLDYKALLNTNFSHGADEVNLFEIAVEHLLRDYPVAHNGRTSSIGQLWAEVESAMPADQKPSSIAKIIQACVDFNTAFQPAVHALLPKINELITVLGWKEMVLTAMRTPGLTYQPAKLKRDRALNGQLLEPKLTFRNHPLDRPHHFLNEARLSGLGLAIYLAGRLTCTPTTTPSALKLLVLDDVLIGLDHSNRLPVLNVLVDLFPDWQVVLLTHDRGWFDLARKRLPAGDWTCYEVYEGDPAAVAPMPVVRRTEKRPALALLQKARDLLVQGYMEAAANYVRQAFETGIRGACEVKSIKMPFKQDVTGHKAQDLLNGLKGWPGTVTVPKADWDAALHRLELMKDVVMNPYSHPSAPNIPRQEVVDAANAVEKFLELAGKK